MSTEIRVLQENVNDQFAVLVAWLVPDGRPVAAGQPVAELQTSKAVFDVQADAPGILVHRRALGDEVPVGEVLAVVLSESEFAAQPPAPATAPEPAPPPGAAEEPAPTPAGQGGSPPTDGLRATPGARKLADSLGLDLSTIAVRGIIREKDVLAHQAASAARKTSAAPQTPHAAPKPPEELLRQWKILDPQQLPPGGWLIYSQDFVTRMMSGGYGREVPASPAVKVLVPVVLAAMAVFQAVIWLLAKLPVLGTGVEILARVYRRNPFGFLLRGAYYKARLGAMGQDTIIDQYVDIWGPKNVTVGRGCHLDAGIRLASGEESQSQLGRIQIGDHVHIGPQCLLAGRGGLTIGSYTAITASSKIFSATNVGENPDDPYDLLPMSHCAPLARQHTFQAPVTIADHVFVGLNVCILPGVTIGRGAIINSGAVITHDVPEFAIMGGNPARLLGYRVPRPNVRSAAAATAAPKA